MSRRALLLATAMTAAAAGLGSGLSGCEAGPAVSPRQTQTPTDPLTPVLLGQQQLQGLYQQVLSTFPELALTLTGLQAQTDAHTRALLAAAPVAAAQVASPGSGSTPRAGSSPVPEPLPPGDAATAISDLRTAVDAAAGSLRSAALRANGDLAALLGSCAASTACHALMLA